jgi:DNA-binding XRE family transcriptional regulator
LYVTIALQVSKEIKYFRIFILSYWFSFNLFAMTDGTFLKKLGERIESYRESIGLSRDGLAKKVGISRMQIYRIETGSDDGNPSVLVLKKIATELKISVSELINIE